jgi:hypothetical protein
MADNIYVGPRKRTERTAMREAVRMSDEWWAKLGYPEKRVRAVSARRLTSVKGWSVTVEYIR